MMEQLSRIRKAKTGVGGVGLRRGFTWVELIVALVVVFIIAAILFPVFSRAKISDGRSMLSSVKQTALGCLMYASDSDDRLPLAHNWIDGVMPYVKNEWVFRDRDNEDLKEGEIGIAFYRPLSGVDSKWVDHPEEIPLTFQSTLLHRNAASDLSTLPDPPRNKRNNVSFLDGHVKAVELDWPETPIDVRLKPLPETIMED